MNIAISSMYLPSGSKIGVGYQVHYLANALIKRGHKVTVFSQTGASKDFLYDVVIVPSGNRFRTFGFAWNLRKYDFTRFDVLNAHGDDWFLWGCNLPRHIHTFHGSYFAEMLNIKPIREKLRMAILALCEYGSCLLADELVAVSECTRKYLPLVKRVIPDGVNLDVFHPAKEKSTNPSLLFVGTMRYRKRGAMLLDLFKQKIRRAIPKSEFWAVCEERVDGEGVRWFGRLPTNELADLYRRAWVFCLPSTYEGFGVPYIEAMASGTPVVASPNVGAIEVTENGKYGLIAKDKDLAETLVQVLTDSSLRKKLREDGLKRAQDFSWDMVCARYEAIYANNGRRSEGV